VRLGEIGHDAEVPVAGERRDRVGDRRAAIDANNSRAELWCRSTSAIALWPTEQDREGSNLFGFKAHGHRHCPSVMFQDIGDSSASGHL
jgi:hypothetical protein